jgi:hypothetical protein
MHTESEHVAYAHAQIDRLIRKPPTPHAEAVAARAAIEKVNRAVRDDRNRNRRARLGFTLSVLD